MNLYFGIIQQQLYIPGSISANPDSYNSDPSGDAINSIINSSSAWEVDASSVPSWISISNGSGVSGENLEAIVNLNGNVMSRDVNIKVWLTDDHNTFALIYVYQNPL
jgi:hypothetical protein